MVIFGRQVQIRPPTDTCEFRDLVYGLGHFGVILVGKKEVRDDEEKIQADTKTNGPSRVSYSGGSYREGEVSLGLEARRARRNRSGRSTINHSCIVKERTPRLDIY